jgi:hypothetical protein
MICRYVLDTSIAIFLGTKTSSAHSGAHLL